jgi:hypothetical protein
MFDLGVDIQSVHFLSNVTSTKCYSGLNVQWTFHLGRNVQWISVNGRSVQAPGSGLHVRIRIRNKSVFQFKIINHLMILKLILVLNPSQIPFYREIKGTL